MRSWMRGALKVLALVAVPIGAFWLTVMLQGGSAPTARDVWSLAIGAGAVLLPSLALVYAPLILAAYTWWPRHVNRARLCIACVPLGVVPLGLVAFLFDEDDLTWWALMTARETPSWAVLFGTFGLLLGFTLPLPTRNPGSFTGGGRARGARAGGGEKPAPGVRGPSLRSERVTGRESRDGVSATRRT
ncbi:MAG: hypothetical protein HY825_18310 [Acidobacteria bacterium]|nr:hypothetical protein [Acidobacteriota bacterium]